MILAILRVFLGLTEKCGTLPAFPTGLISNSLARKAIGVFSIFSYLFQVGIGHASARIKVGQDVRVFY